MAEERAGLIVRWVAAVGEGRRFARVRLPAVVVELQAWNCQGGIRVPSHATRPSRAAPYVYSV